MNKGKNKNIKLVVSIIKMIIGITLLITLLVLNDNGKMLLEEFSKFNSELIVLILFNGILMNIVSSAKWKLFLTERGINLSLLRLFVLYFIGKFFNNFVPSMIGGDISRIYLLGKQIDSHSKSAASVFLERFTGLIAMIILGSLFSIINYDIISEPLIGISVLFMVLATIFFLVIIYIPAFYKYSSRLLSKLPVIGSKIIKLLKDIVYFKVKHKVIAYAMLYSFVFHIQTSIAVYLCCLAIGFYPSFLDIAVVTPIILLIVTIPVSPNNLGWWEWSFSILLAEIGAVAAQGLAVALTLRAVTMLFSLCGGLFFLLEKINNRNVAHEGIK